MFEKLYSNETISKLKKMPIIVWYLLFGVASFFSSIYSVTSMGQEFITAFSEMFSGVNARRLLIVYYPLTFILDVIIFEVIAYLVYSLIAKRFFLQLSQDDFVFRLRLTMIIINVIIGLVSLIFFIVPEAQLLTNAIVTPFAQAFFLAFFFFEICKNFVPLSFAHKVYLYIARIYLVVFIAINAINLITLFTLEGVKAMEYLAAGARLLVYSLMFFLVYYHYNKLKSIPPKEPPKDEQEKPDETVFKDFGF